MWLHVNGVQAPICVCTKNRKHYGTRQEKIRKIVAAEENEAKRKVRFIFRAFHPLLIHPLFISSSSFLSSTPHLACHYPAVQHAQFFSSITERQLFNHLFRFNHSI
jgi:hypothetical protein